MKNQRAIELVNSMIKSKYAFTDKRWRKLGDTKYESIYGKWDSESFYDLRNLLFNLITGEPDFDKFYSRFDAPAGARGDKPTAWGRRLQEKNMPWSKKFAKFFKNGKNEHITRFLPDQICDAIWDTDISLTKKVKEIKLLYKMCQILEEDFK